MDIMCKKIAIIGNGGAAAECIKALRDNGYNGEIHLLTDSRWPICNPMLTTYYIAGKIGFENLFPYGKDEFYQQNGVEPHIGSPVILLDTEKRLVANRAGFELRYDQCLIASGASPLLPSITGMDSQNIYVLRNVEDAIRLKEALDKKPRKVVIIGASLIGIKLVELFYQAGIEICLADIARNIFTLNAHQECAGIIEDRLMQMGIILRFGAGIRKIEDTPGGIKAYFTEDSETEEADLAVMCTGIRPNIGFINHRQIEVDRGVLVDERMQANITGLYAAGDVSQGKNLLTGRPQIFGLWSSACQQGRTAGRNMAGNLDLFSGTVPHNITHFLGIDFVGIGDVCEYDKMEKRYDGKKFIQIFWRNGLLTGANLVDTINEAGIIKNALIKGLVQTKPTHCNLSSSIPDILMQQILAEAGKG